MRDVCDVVEKVNTAREYRRGKSQIKPGKYGDTAERTTIDRAPTFGESDSLHGMMFAPGCGQKSTKTGLSSLFALLDIETGARNSCVRQGVSLETAIEIEKKYGASVPDHLILDR